MVLLQTVGIEGIAIVVAFILSIVLIAGILHVMDTQLWKASQSAERNSRTPEEGETERE